MKTSHVSSVEPVMRGRRGGYAAVLAMLFLMLMSTLAIAMVGMSTSNVQSASNLANAARARAAAESGLRWQAYRFQRMVRPRTLAGVIDADVANSLWPDVKTAVKNDYATLLAAADRLPPVDQGARLVGSPVALDPSRHETFSITITKNGLDPTVLTVTSTGRYGDAVRSVSMDFKLDKRVSFAVVGRVPIQLGRNTIVEGPVAMTIANKYPPLLMLSDFMHLDPALKTKLAGFNTFLQTYHDGYDNRVSVNDAWEWNRANSSGYRDTNGDKFIDEYDIFLRHFDKNGDGRIHMETEFKNLSTGKYYDENLFKAIDSLGAPMGDEEFRYGYQDGYVDNYDAYAKVSGQIKLAVTEKAWSDHLAGQGKTINDMIQGVIVPEQSTQQPVLFNSADADMLDITPATFDACAQAFRAKTGAAAGPTSRGGGRIENTVLAASDANGGVVTEESPKGSKNFQAVYKRPVFKNLTLKNVQIPKGLNPLFQNCKFEGVTFVDTERNITASNGTVTTDPGTAMSWSKRATSGTTAVDTSGSFQDTNGDGKWDQYKIAGMSSFAYLVDTNGDGVKAEIPTTASAYGTGGTDKKSLGSTKGNNVRFDNCTFEGPIANNYATAYSHFANSWEFTGATLFDNKVDQTATIVAPQTNIEMGSFTDPSKAPSTLVGVVVAGNIDIRGTSNVDGSIIITGDGAGNTTLAYFGANDGDTDAGANPEGGFGRLNIRYNPTRALPDGIDLPVSFLPLVGTYTEGVP